MNYDKHKTWYYNSRQTNTKHFCIIIMKLWFKFMINTNLFSKSELFVLLKITSFSYDKSTLTQRLSIQIHLYAEITTDR